MHENIKFSEMGSLENLNPGTEFNFRVFSTFSRILNDKLETEELENTTGGTTKDATSTTAVESLSSHVLKNSVDYNRSLTVFLFPIFFIYVYKGQAKSKDRHTYTFAWFEKFYVVAEVASVLGNPVYKRQLINRIV